MESFDQSLKYLLHKEPADFIRFGLGDMTVEVVEPIPSNLPSRGRDVDGGYRIRRGEDDLVAHVEFHRRHQCEAIEARAELGPSARADHLAVL